jgi:hypothetical protein
MTRDGRKVKHLAPAEILDGFGKDVRATRFPTLRCPGCGAAGFDVVGAGGGGEPAQLGQRRRLGRRHDLRGTGMTLTVEQRLQRLGQRPRGHRSTSPTGCGAG